MPGRKSMDAIVPNSEEAKAIDEAVNAAQKPAEAETSTEGAESATPEPEPEPEAEAEPEPEPEEPKGWAAFDLTALLDKIQSTASDPFAKRRLAGYLTGFVDEKTYASIRRKLIKKDNVPVGDMDTFDQFANSVEADAAFKAFTRVTYFAWTVEDACKEQNAEPALVQHLLAANCVGLFATWVVWPKGMK